MENKDSDSTTVHYRLSKDLKSYVSILMGPFQGEWGLLGSPKSMFLEIQVNGKESNLAANKGSIGLDA